MKIKIIGFCLLLTSLSGCFFDEPDADSNVVLLDDVIFTSSNRVRLLGRIFSSTDNISDHGFEFSESENFENPIIESLGSKGRVGGFLVEVNILKQSTKYFYRAFMVAGNNITYSSVDTLNTFTSMVNSFSPAFGNPGDRINIFGSNFTNDAEVFFGDNSAEIVARISDYQLTIIVPEYTNQLKFPLKVRMENKTFELDDFEYISGVWSLVSEVDGHVTNPAFFFQNEILSLIGSQNDQGQAISTIWNYDLNIDQWTKSEYADRMFTFGAFFDQYGLIGSGANEFVDGGLSQFYVNSDSLWQFNQPDVVTQIGVTPFRTFGSTAKTVNNETYVFGGALSFSGGILDRTVKLDANGNWSVLNAHPWKILGEIGSTVYNEDVIFLNSEGIWLKYKVASDEFQEGAKLINTPVAVGPILAYNEGIYFGNTRYTQKFFRLDFDSYEDFTYRIIPQTDFPGIRPVTTIAHFENNGLFYYLRKDISEGADDKMQLWSFEPNKI